MMNLMKSYQLFITYQLASGNSPATIEYYKYCLKPFINWFGNDFFVCKLNKNNIQNYAVDLRHRNLSSVSIRSYSKGIKSFLSWLFKEKYTSINLSELYILPKQQVKEINILSENEIKLILNSFNINTKNGLRNYLIISLMYDSGLRKQEIINLNLKDIDLILNKILINGKGNKQRFVPIGKITSKQLKNYLTKYSIPLKSSIFETANNQPITNSTLNRLFKTLKTKLNIERLHPHLLRHTFATQFLINGGSIAALQKILGHADIQTVQIYLHLAQSHTISQFAQYSPLDHATYN